jgi:fatty acid desaturase
MRGDAFSPAPALPGAALRRIEWPTLGLLLGVHAAWALILTLGGGLPPWAVVPLLGPLLTLHSSLQHEVLHGHPFRDAHANEATVFLPLGLMVPYRRFRDQHLAHHHDPNLTDPYDDPETNYVDPAVWQRMSPLRRLVLRANNTLLGRMALGPFLSLAEFLRGDLRAMRAGDAAVARAWSLHALGVVPVLAAIAVSGLSFWTYLAACWLALAILRIRTFLEHQAELRPRARSVIIEDRGPLAFLFLNNNFHALHHARPCLPWYALPAAYAAERAEVLRRNGGYRYRSYRQVIARHLLRAKDPVAHPFWTWGNRTTAREDAEALLAGVLPDPGPQAPAPAEAAIRR